MFEPVPFIISAGWTPGPMEIAIFAAIVLIFFGPKRLPQLSRAIGRSITDFKRGLHDVQRDIEDSSDDDDELDEKPSNRRISGRTSGVEQEASAHSQSEEQKVKSSSQQNND